MRAGVVTWRLRACRCHDRYKHYAEREEAGVAAKGLRTAAPGRPGERDCYCQSVRRALAALGVIALMSAACAEVRSAEAPLSPTPAPVETIAADPSPSRTPSPTRDPDWSLTVAAVGDIMLSRSVAHAVTEADPAGPFRYVRDQLAVADLTIGNLECALSERGPPEPKSYTFRGPPLAAEGLARAGFDALGLANNHSLDYGPDALADTRTALTANGIAAPGAGDDAAEAAAPAIVERGGVRIAVLAFSDIAPDSGSNWAAGPDRPGLAWAEPDAVAAAVTAARAGADAVVVLFHFGIEGSNTATDTQRYLARMAIDAGALLVLGSHPHVLQEVEEYGGGLIAYSLGNFVFDGFEDVPGGNDSAILNVTLGAGGVREWQLVPVRIGYDGLPRPGS